MVAGVNQLSLMYLRKQNTFSERRIYRYAGMEDLRSDLVMRMRQMAVARRHLPDKFVLDGDVRKSARDIIVRELVSNLLIHREFMSPFPAKLIIDEGGIRTENASRALYEGRITLSDFNPMPKNPTIADVFTNIGRAEELGSGMRNLDKFSRLYSGRVATLEDGDVFRANVPVVRTIARSGRDAIFALASSIIERDGSLSTAELARAGDVSVRTGQRWVRSLLESGRIKVSADDAKRYVLTDRAGDINAT